MGIPLSGRVLDRRPVASDSVRYCCDALETDDVSDRRC